MRRGNTLLKPGLEVSVSDLNARPDWLDQLSLWQHLLWREAHEIEETSAQAIKKDIQNRRTSMQEHLLSSADIPHTLVAHHNNRACGCISLIYYFISAEPQNRQVWLSNFYVEPQLRNRGVGSALLQRAEEYASQLVPCLRLFTRDKQSWYQRRGWRVGGKSLVEGQAVSILIKQMPQCS